MSMGPSKYENNFPDRQCLNINKVVCSFINVKSIRKVFCAYLWNLDGFCINKIDIDLKCTASL
jgi:hypothetical protein